MGFERAGFRTIWANDIDRDACETLQSWSEAEVICGDISKLLAKDIPSADIILGGFPCQGFSLSGPRNVNDSRNKLYKEYVRIVRQCNPLAFVGENVKGLLTMGGGAVMQAIINDFAECGYSVSSVLLNAKDFGIAQDRERVMIVGFRNDLEIDQLLIPLYRGQPQTLADALQGLPPMLADEVCRAAFSSRYMSRNRKRKWNEVSYTIPAMSKQVALHPDSPDMVKLGTDSWRFGDGGETRRLSWRECAAIQTFPRDLEFRGDLVSKYRQIGNAVPVELAYTVAEAVYRALEERV